MASELVKIISDSSFENDISSGISLVDFWAEWCGPCRMQGPILDTLAEKMGDKVKICKLNVDENPGTAQKYSVMSIPTIMIFKDGKMAKQFIGVQNEATLASAISAL